MIRINGAYKEGGGQIVRTSAALSSLLTEPIRITGIRKGRSQPGLKNQHMHSLLALKEMTDAETLGLEKGSSKLEFIPKRLRFKNMNIDIGTAGSITLVLQALMPVLLFSEKKITVRLTGGTDTKNSMPIDYFTNVFLPHMRKYADIKTSIERRGYYPKGNGKFIMKITPIYSIKDFKSVPEFLRFIRSEDKKIMLENQGKMMLIKGVSHASKDLLKANVAERQAKTARYLLSRAGVPVNIKIEYVESDSTGSGICLWALFSDKDELDFKNPVILGADSLGERGKKAEDVGKEAAIRLLEEIDSGAAADRHLADQMLPYISLFGGSIKTSEITMHCKTNRYAVEKFLDRKIKIRKNKIYV